MPFNNLTPMLEVENMDKTIEFYETILDFKCVKREGHEWVIVQKDHISIMFSARFFTDEYPNIHDWKSIHKSR